MKKTQVPLLKCVVAHQIHGRVRFVCRALRYLAPEGEDLREHFLGLPGVSASRLDCRAESAVLNYDNAVTTAEALQEAVEGIIAMHSLSALQKEREERNALSIQERNLREETVPAMLGRAALAAGLLVASWLRGAPAAPATGLGKFLNLNAVGALALSLPLVRSGAATLLRSARPNADTLSVLAIAASVLSGRAASAFTVIMLHELAEAMAAFTMHRTRNAIRDMLSVEEELAWKIADPESEALSLVRVKAAELRPGDAIVIHTGEKIPADAVVTAGSGHVNQASITGEYEPVSRRAGGKVFAGTVLTDGTLTARVENAGEATAVSRIIKMVEDADAKKAAIQTYADRFSSALVPLNLLLAAGVLLATRDVNRALNMLIIDYSCGIRLSTAAALSAAISTAAHNGVLIKGSACLETLNDADTLILDKTGTLTEGRPQVVSVVSVNAKQYDKRRVLALAAAAEETSKHPMAAAVMSQARRECVAVPAHGETQTFVGRGVATSVDGQIVRVGNKKFMNENAIHTHPLREAASKLFADGENVVFVACGEEIAGLIGIRDPLRENMKKAINRLRYDAGVDDIVLLTGDLEQQADVVAQRLGLDSFASELLPEDKAKAVLKMQSRGSKVVMIGDGINDAPGLAYADVGIALGNARTDVAMEAADVTIAGDNALLLPGVYGLAKQTMRTIKQNFATAVGINSLGLLLGAAGLLPVIWGAVLHNASTILVVGNSLRLLFYRMDVDG